jgi:hypothetical protein
LVVISAATMIWSEVVTAWWRVALWPAAESASVLHHPAGAVGLISLVRAPLGPPVLGEPPAAGLEALGAIARHRLGVLGALALERFLGLAKPGAPAVRGPKYLGQLIAARVAVELVLGGVPGFGDDLGGDLLVAADRSVRSRGGELGAVDRD